NARPRSHSSGFLQTRRFSSRPQRSNRKDSPDQAEESSRLALTPHRLQSAYASQWSQMLLLFLTLLLHPLLTIYPARKTSTLDSNACKASVPCRTCAVGNRRILACHANCE